MLERALTRLRARSTRAAQEEGGYVLVIVTILLTVLLAFAGLTLDFGSWYARSAQIQRAADAAALAGVVWMPEFDAAEAAARAAATRNGFTDGVNNIVVDVNPVPDNNRQLEVVISDTKVHQFFSSLVLKRQGIDRASTAEYVLPVPLGSPKNTLGTGDLLAGTDRENFWLAVNGACAGHESGDDLLSQYESYTSGTGPCNNGSPASNNYDPAGYIYAIDLPQNTTSMKVEVYDAGYYNSGSAADFSLASGNENLTTTIQIYDRNPTPLDLSNITLLKTVTIAADSSASTYQNKWVNMWTWTNPKAGQYYVRVKTLGGEQESQGSNGFGLHAYTGASFATCTTITGATGYSATCPQVHGVNSMSIFANGASTTSDFYLAQIDAVNAGKTMRISLFDPGEGSNTLQILDPNGNISSFSWFTDCNPPTPPTGGCSGSGTSLDVSATGTQPYTGLNGTSKYNDRYLILDIPLPANYSTLYGTKVWWKVRYTAGSAPTDRTTWAVNIVGDPVHLVK